VDDLGLCDRLMGRGRGGLRSEGNRKATSGQTPAEHRNNQLGWAGDRLGEDELTALAIDLLEPPADGTSVLDLEAPNGVALEVMAAFARFDEEKPRSWSQDREG
jgi:hypothetical protein